MAKQNTQNQTEKKSSTSHVPNQPRKDQDGRANKAGSSNDTSSKKASESMKDYRTSEDEDMGDDFDFDQSGTMNH